MTTLYTISFEPRIRVRESVRTGFGFEPITASTAAQVEETDTPNETLVEMLIALTTSGDSLDWDALARINIEGWGAEPGSE